MLLAVQGVEKQRFSDRHFWHGGYDKAGMGSLLYPSTPNARTRCYRLGSGSKAAINRLDRFHLLILDDLAYVSKDQAETSVLFDLISARYEHRSILITANQPFGAWGKVFPDPTMTLAAVDRLVHHATIFEINVDSYRRRAALNRKTKGAGRPQSYATIKDLEPVSPPDNQTQT